MAASKVSEAATRDSKAQKDVRVDLVEMMRYSRSSLRVLGVTFLDA